MHSALNVTSSASVAAVVTQLFRHQALTISKSGTEVLVQCENGGDANAVFDWLTDIGDDTEGDPIGWKRVRYWFRRTVGMSASDQSVVHRPACKHCRDQYPVAKGDKDYCDFCGRSDEDFGSSCYCSPGRKHLMSEKTTPVASADDIVPALPNIKAGSKVLVTTNEWFYAPDGRTYRAVFGTVRGVFTSESTLGVRTNAKSTNWYLDVGCVTIAGCQIHYMVACESANFEPVRDWGMHDGKAAEYTRPSCVFNGDLQ